jgi:predicted DNA-binding transcriptional regulator AlpA
MTSLLHGQLSARQVAELCGLSLDQFYVQRYRLHVEQGLPRPFRGRGSDPTGKPVSGRPCWSRASVMAWVERHHPAMPRTIPANDQSPPLAGEHDPRWRALLQAEYGGA